MAIILNPQKLRRFVLERDKQKLDDDPTKTVWLLKVPTGKIADDIWSSAVGLDEGKEMSNADTVLRCAELGIAGWEKLTDEDGEPMSYTKQLVGSLPFDLKMELGGEIFNLMSLGAEEAKN